MSELWLVVWIAISPCAVTYNTNQFKDCPESMSLESKIVSSSTEAVELYEQHKETVKAFKIIERGGEYEKCITEKVLACKKALSFNTQPSSSLMNECLEPCKKEGIEIKEKIWKPIPSGEWVDKDNHGVY